MMLPKEIEFIVYEYLVLPLWPNGQMLHIINREEYDVKYVRHAFIRQEYQSDFKRYMTRKLRSRIPDKIPLQCLTMVHSRVVFGTPITKDRNSYRFYNSEFVEKNASKFSFNRFSCPFPGVEFQYYHRLPNKVPFQSAPFFRLFMNDYYYTRFQAYMNTYNKIFLSCKSDHIKIDFFDDSYVCFPTIGENHIEINNQTVKGILNGIIFEFDDSKRVPGFQDVCIV